MAAKSKSTPKNTNPKRIQIGRQNRCQAIHQASSKNPKIETNTKTTKNTKIRKKPVPIRAICMRCAGVVSDRQWATGQNWPKASGKQLRARLAARGSSSARVRHAVKVNLTLRPRLWLWLWLWFNASAVITIWYMIYACINIHDVYQLATLEKKKTKELSKT